MLRHWVFLTLSSLLVFMIAGCQTVTPIPTVTTTVIPPPILLTVAVVQGTVDILPEGNNTYESLKVEQKVGVGDRLRVGSGKSFAELRDERSFIVIGPGAKVIVEALSADPQVTQTLLCLETGGVLAAAEKSLEPGSLVVLTPGGKAAIHGSAMAVSLNSTTSTTSVTCTQGSAAVTTGSSSLVLSSGTSTSFSNTGRVEPTQTYDEKVQAQDPLLWEVISDRYYHYGVSQATDYPTLPEPTRKPTATITLTPRPTFTQFVLEATSTHPVDLGGIPTRRPTTTAIPGNAGLTPEEEANQGTHTYKVGCSSWGKCVCDSALATPEITITIQFEKDQVSFSNPEGGSIVYKKAAPNLYRLEGEDYIVEITFLAEGWEFYMTKAGKPCSLQTYTRQ